MMSPVTEQVFQAALRLSGDERSELIAALLASQEHSDELPFDSEWLEEVQRRSADLDAGNVQCTPWSVVRERVRKRVEGLSSD
jgi:putative addiction module component (TIGR02574 family)